MNEQSNLTHKPLRCEPVEAKDRDRLESMYRMVCATTDQAHDCLAALAPIDGTIYDRLTSDVMLVSVPVNPKFKGVALCVHCISRAAMLLRDLANTCDDIIKEAEKHGKAV